jgi:hypothetical protein
MVTMLQRASVRGRFLVMTTDAGVIFIMLLLYKAIDLGVLSLFMQWNTAYSGNGNASHTFGVIGTGVYVREGVLVWVKSLMIVFVYILVYNRLQNRRDIERLAKYQIACVLLVVVVGLVQWIILDHRVITSTFRNVYALEKYMYLYGVEDPWFGDTAVGHEHLGAYLVISAAILMGMLIYQSYMKIVGKRAVYVLLIGCTFCLILASSRGAWIGGMFMFLSSMLLAVKFGQSKRMFSLLILLIVLLIIIQMVGLIDLVTIIYDRVQNLFVFSDGEIKDDSGKKRLRLLLSLWDLFLEHPIVGLGPGGAGRIAESQFMRELVEGGVLGFTLFTCLIYKVGRIAADALRYSDSPLMKALGSGLVCALIGLLGQSLFTELFILTKVSIPFWIWAALIHKFSHLELSKSGYGDR